jgi:hypothetical protein
LYNEVHFVLNGLRGLIMPWLGSALYVFIGQGALLIAALVVLVSMVPTTRGLRNEARLVAL